MNTNVNLEAAAGVLALMGTGLLLSALGAVVVYALIKRKRALARKVLFAGAAFVVLYVGGMIAFSLVSSEKVLARGEEKYFCEIDCHLAYAVVGVRRAKTLGNPPEQANAGGEFYVVTVRTRFDENTITPTRGDFPLSPNPRDVAAADAQGRRYTVSAEGQRALELSGTAGKPISTPLRPGESYTTELVFDLPPDATNPILLINESMLPTRFIIGHENSFLHKQTKFRLDAQAGESAREL
jgi:hypothetical protein